MKVDPSHALSRKGPARFGAKVLKACCFLSPSAWRSPKASAAL
jgi:hypothetical protein